MQNIQQSVDSPIYPEIIWDKPENTLNAGTICILGGNSHAIKEPSVSYQCSLNNTLKERKVVLPDSTKKYFDKSNIPSDMLFAPSNISGSFSSKSLIELQTYVNWADCTVMAGDFTKSSETTILINNIISKKRNLTALCNDSIDILLQSEDLPLNNKNLILVCSFSQFQKICIKFYSEIAFTSNMSQLMFSNKLAELTNLSQCFIIVEYQNKVFTANNGNVVVSVLGQELIKSPSFYTKLATSAAIWSMQQPTKQFQALTTSVLFVK